MSTACGGAEALAGQDRPGGVLAQDAGLRRGTGDAGIDAERDLRDADFGLFGHDREFADVDQRGARAEA